MFDYNIYGIHNLRQKHPEEPILIRKLDIDAAYRRVHVVPSQAVLTIKIIDGIGYILLCLPFGLSPGPSLFSQVSEPIFDKTNELLNNKSWGPKQLNTKVCKLFDDMKL